MTGLVERDAVLSQLRAALDRVRSSGTGEVAIVTGEAGVGKTSVLRALVAAVAGGDDLWGACDGLRTPRPLGPLLDIAATVGGTWRDLRRTSRRQRHHGTLCSGRSPSGWRQRRGP